MQARGLAMIAAETDLVGKQLGLPWSCTGRSRPARTVPSRWHVINGKRPSRPAVAGRGQWFTLQTERQLEFELERNAATTTAAAAATAAGDDAYGDVSGYNRRWQIGRCRRVLDGGLGVGAWRPLRLVSVRIPRSSTGNLVSVQGGFC